MRSDRDRIVRLLATAIALLCEIAAAVVLLLLLAPRRRSGNPT
jgi:hypothetical protein